VPQPSLPDEAPHLLLVDDDTRIRSLLARYLQQAGYRVSTAASAAEARMRMSGLSFDLLILDVMMPGESGFDLARDVRRRSDVPILMLTARGEANDRIEGLEIGADDYVAKPFEPRELALRISSILRRLAEAPPRSKSEEVRFGTFAFHAGRGELYDGEERVHLTDRERDMLTLLAERNGGTVARWELAVGDVGDRAVDVQINRLRRKIERDPADPSFLKTVRGTGYRLLTEP